MQNSNPDIPVFHSLIEGGLLFILFLKIYETSLRINMHLKKNVFCPFPETVFFWELQGVNIQ